MIEKRLKNIARNKNRCFISSFTAANFQCSEKKSLMRLRGIIMDEKNRRGQAIFLTHKHIDK
ncbi:hypothetical protein L579_0950 [Pantoea sp. AS-PWVM4]|nr:hypothetical protein L579_0950 [Pantoea sp. AS-PWVM4]